MIKINGLKGSALAILALSFCLLYLLFPISNNSIDAWGFAKYVKNGESLFLSHHLFYNAAGFVWVKLINLFFCIDTLKLLIALNALFAAATLYILGLTLRLLGVEGKRSILWVAFLGSSWAIMRYATENETYIFPLFFSLLGSYYFLKSLKDNRLHVLFLSGLFAATACLFHQIMFFWWLSLLIGVASRRKVKSFVWFVLPAIIVPVSYLLVLAFYNSQPISFESLTRFVFRDYYSGAAGISTGLSSFMLLGIGIVRSFFQVHGYIINLSHFSPLFYIGILLSIILLLCAVFQIRKISWGWINVKEQALWVHLLAIILQLIFALLSDGNAEFLVMIPLLTVIVLAQLISNEIRFVRFLALGMLIWNLSVGLLPLHFYNLDDSNILSAQVIKNQNEAKQPLYVLFSRPRIENEVEYHTGVYPKNLITGIQYDDVNIVKARVNEALENGLPVFTDCYNRPRTISRETLVVQNKYETQFSEYHYQKVDSIESLTGKYYIYSITKK